MQILGEMILGRRSIKGAGWEMRAVEAATGKQLDPAFGGGYAEHVDRACVLAEAAFDRYRQLSDERLAAFLDAIGQGLLDLGEPLIDRVMLESALRAHRK
jgi:2,5-dioxopentanoate dehydrogenase